MKYSIKQGESTHEVDDLTPYDKQPKDFREAFSALASGNTAQFDNASVMVFDSGRVIVTQNMEEL